MLHSNTKAPFLVAIDEELHDVRRVLAQGEEDDLRGALQIMIRRVEEMKGLFVERDRIASSEKEKLQQSKDKIIEDLQHQLTEKEVQLGVTTSNLKMVTANNEMLEQALRDGGGGLGWSHRRVESLESQQPPPQQKEDSKFFNKFRFSSRPGTPSASPNPNSLNRSPTLPQAASTPNLRLSSDEDHSEREENTLRQEIEKREKREKELRESLEKEKEARTALEAELESLSQALFEEANKMVSTERRKRAETEEELREAREEKEALKNALRIVESENVKMRASSNESLVDSLPSHSRESSVSSIVGTKSRPSSRSSTILQRPLSKSYSPHPPPTEDDYTSAPSSPASSTSSLERAEVEQSLESLSSMSSTTESDTGYAAATEDNTDDELSTHVHTPAVGWETAESSPWADMPGSPPPKSNLRS